MNTSIKHRQAAGAISTACSGMLFLGIITLLAGCASTAPTHTGPDNMAQMLKERHLQQLSGLKQFSLQGRIGVQTNSKGFSGSLHWQHNATADDINLYSPLGNQVASIRKTPDQVILKDASDKTFSAVDAETLTQKTLGWKLPLKGLTDWAIGRPTQSPVQNSTWNEAGHLTWLEQDGWKIEYDNYQQQGSYTLPGKIYLKSDQLNLKLLVEKWNKPEQ